MRVCLLIMLFGCFVGMAQNSIDIAKAYYSISPNNQFNQSSVKTNINEVGLDLTYPIALKSNNFIITGLAFENFNVKPDTNEVYQSFTSIAFRVGLNKSYSERWSATYLLIPKLASDLKSKSYKNFQLGALALIRFTQHKQLNYKMGLYFNSELFGPFITPILGLYYLSPNQKLEVNLNLPQTADLNFSLSKSLSVGLNFTGQIKSYRISQLYNSSSSGYLVKATNEICPYIKFYLGKNLSLQARAGYSIGRTYRIYREDDKIDLAISFNKIGEDRFQLNNNFSNGLVFQTLMVYRIVKD